MNKRQLNAALSIMLSVRVFAQASDDDNIIKALSYSNIYYESKYYIDDLKGIISVLYGQTNASYQKELLAKAISTFDDKYVFQCIKESIMEISSMDFVEKYNKYHETREYERINRLELRDITKSELEEYKFSYESDGRKALFLKLIKEFDTNVYSAIYQEGMLSLVISLDSNISNGRKTEVYRRIRKAVEESLKDESQKNNALDYYSACYHELNDGELAAYINYFASKEINDFYKAIYEGLKKGIIGKEIAK